MFKAKYILFAMLILCGSVANIRPAGALAQSSSLPSHPAGFALVELFTSQGCSSCPPADHVLEGIVRSARASDAPVYALSFHVDYWNHLGWRDPYSKKEFSDRQRRYGKVFGGETIYTPQMIVNGREEFVGSQAERAESSIRSALETVPLLKISVQIDSSRPNELRCAYNIVGAWQGAVLNVALVQDMQAISVSAGENSGRKLSHVNVVRSFVSIPIVSAQGQCVVPIPSDVALRRCSVVLYAQHGKTLNVLGATNHHW